MQGQWPTCTETRHILHQNKFGFGQEHKTCVLFDLWARYSNSAILWIGGDALLSREKRSTRESLEVVEGAQRKTAERANTKMASNMDGVRAAQTTIERC